MRQQIQFIKHFLRNPIKVGAIAQLNDQVAISLVKYIKQSDSQKPIKILEVGAGYGNISEHVLQLVKADDIVDIVEVDEKCCQHLNTQFGKRKNVHIHCCSIQNWKPDYEYDFIISTLPFNSYPASFVENVINRYQDLSNDRTICSYVEYSGIGKIRESFAQGPKKSMIKARQKLLSEFKDKYLIDRNCILNNIPPCNVYHLRLS
jgi:phospholipid N-methyltransferase